MPKAFMISSRKVNDPSSFTDTEIGKYYFCNNYKNVVTFILEGNLDLNQKFERITSINKPVCDDILKYL